MLFRSVSFAFGFATMFCYISASPFVIQNQMGLSVQAYTLVFAVNAGGMVLANMLNSRLVEIFDPHLILRTVQILLLALSVALLIAVSFTVSPWVVLPLLFLAISQIGILMGNSTALGTGEVRERAGSGSAVMGFLQFTMGAVVSPFMGLGANAALTMAVGMVVCVLISLAGSLYAGGRRTAAAE